MATNLSDLSAAQLKQAASIKEQITKLQGQLVSLFGSSGSTSKPTGGSGMSAATRAKLSALAKARWAGKRKAGHQPSQPSPTVAPKKTSTLTAAGRKKLSDAAKARWALIKKGKSQPAPLKAKASVSTAPKARKPMSAAQKAQIAATLKARWAKIKAGKK